MNPSSVLSLIMSKVDEFDALPLFVQRVTRKPPAPAAQATNEASSSSKESKESVRISLLTTTLQAVKLSRRGGFVNNILRDSLIFLGGQPVQTTRKTLSNVQNVNMSPTSSMHGCLKMEI